MVISHPFLRSSNNKFIMKSNRLLRAAINEEIVLDILETLPVKSFENKRAVICILLLYITGCRINELRNFNYINILTLINVGSINIHTYKTKNTRRVDISIEEQKLLENYMDIIKDFYSNIKYTNHVLTTIKGKPVHEKYSYIWLNKVLKPYSEKYGVNLLSHSFRINYVTSLIKNYNAHIAQTIVGHRNIDTTIRYDRNILTSDEVKKIRSKINNTLKLTKKG